MDGWMDGWMDGQQSVLSYVLPFDATHRIDQVGAASGP